MGYKNFQVSKTVYLPLTHGDNLSISEYKKKYGIDLKEYFVISENNIFFKNNINIELRLVLITDDNYIAVPCCNPIADVSRQSYVSGEASAILVIYPVVSVNAEYGFELSVNYSDELTYENIKVSMTEI